MQKKILGVIIIAIIAGVMAFAYSDSETRFWVGKILGLKSQHSSEIPNIIIEEYAVGLSYPKFITFVNDDMLFLDKSDHSIGIIKQGKLVAHIIPDVIQNQDLKIIGIKSDNKNVYINAIEPVDDSSTFGKTFFYKFFWNGAKLVDPDLISVKTIHTDSHHAGNIFVDRYGEIYAVISSDDEKEIPSIDFINYHYGFGIHGFEIDPVTGYVWYTTEAEYDGDYDKINLILPRNDGFERLTWNIPFYPDGMSFAKDLDTAFSDSIFIGNCRTDIDKKGSIFEFKLNSERNDLVYNDPSKDFLDDSNLRVVAKGLGCISDMEINNGELFISSFAKNGAIYKIKST